MHIAHPFGEKYAHLAFTKRNLMPDSIRIVSKLMSSSGRGTRTFGYRIYTLHITTSHTTATIVTHSPHPYRMRSVYHRTFPRAKKCPPDTFCTNLRTGVALPSPCICQKKPSAFALGFFWQITVIRIPNWRLPTLAKYR